MNEAESRADGPDRVVLLEGPEANPADGALLQRLGFAPISATLRMYRGAHSPRWAWRMCMGWPVLNWGEGWGTSGMGRSDRWGALRKPNGVVSSDFLAGLADASGLHGPTGLELRSAGFGVALCLLCLRWHWSRRPRPSGLVLT
jgi:hypothetical protein